MSKSDYFVGTFLLVLFPVCWTAVLGHQMDWFGPDPLQYTLLRAALIMAYTFTAISAGVIAVAIAATIKGKR